MFVHNLEVSLNIPTPLRVDILSGWPFWLANLKWTESLGRGVGDDEETTDTKSQINHLPN